MAETNFYERTQLWKEHTHEPIMRQSAVKAALELASMNNLQLTATELMALTQKFLSYYETGDMSWVAKTDNYLFKTV